MNTLLKITKRILVAAALLAIGFIAGFLSGCGPLVLPLSYVPPAWKDTHNPLRTLGETDFDNPYSPLFNNAPDRQGERTRWRAWEAALVKARAKYGVEAIPLSSDK